MRVNITSIREATKLAYLEFKNPCLDLKQYLEIPLIASEQFFSPSVKSLCAANELFTHKDSNEIRRISRVIHADRFPETNLPEIALMGRSNAGKSSLLKAIFKNQPNLVRTSKKPGHTKSIHFYQIGSKLNLVDMPGYGKNQPDWFESVIVHYLQSRKNLVKTGVIIDGNVGLQELDERTFMLLENLGVPYCVIMSKIDKAPDSTRLRNLIHLQNFIKDNALSNCFAQPFMLSSLTHEGLAHFLCFLGHITGNLCAQD